VNRESGPRIIPAAAPHGRAEPDHLQVCEAAARAGGRVLVEWRGRFGVSQKGQRDLVTEADFAAQREIRRIVLDAFPDHGFVGEEALPEAEQARVPAGGLRWIVDPLDGTTNYVHGFPAYCVSVALARGDEILVGAIYDPVRDECFTARRGAGAWLDGRPIRVPQVTDPSEALAAFSLPPRVSAASPAVADFLAIVPHVHSVRRTGSTALNLAYLACGRLHAFWARQVACWDVAAGFLILQEAGGALGPFGGPTAYGLAVMVEILSAVLSGSLLSFEDGGGQARGNVGHFFMAIDPRAFRGDDEFPQQLDRLSRALRDTAPVDPAQPVRIAGDPERDRLELSRVEGVALPATLVDALQALCARASCTCLLA